MVTIVWDETLGYSEEQFRAAIARGVDRWGPSDTGTRNSAVGNIITGSTAASLLLFLREYSPAPKRKPIAPSKRLASWRSMCWPAEFWADAWAPRELVRFNLTTIVRRQAPRSWGGRNFCKEHR